MTCRISWQIRCMPCQTVVSVTRSGAASFIVLLLVPCGVGPVPERARSWQSPLASASQSPGLLLVHEEGHGIYHDLIHILSDLQGDQLVDDVFAHLLWVPLLGRPDSSTSTAEFYYDVTCLHLGHPVRLDPNEFFASSDIGPGSRGWMPAPRPGAQRFVA